MTTNDTEGGQAVPGTVTEPTVTASTTGVQQPSTVSPAIEVVLKKLTELEQQMRAVQSDKDRGVNKLGKRVDSLKEQLDRYDELLQSGLKPAQARRELQLDALLAQQDTGASGGVEPAQPAGNRGAAPGTDYNSIIVGLGLDANDANVVEVLQKNTDPLATIDGLVKLQQQKNTPTAPVVTNPGQMMPTGGGLSTQAGETLDEVTAQLQAEIAKSVKDMKKIHDLKKKQEALLPRK